MYQWQSLTLDTRLTFDYYDVSLLHMEIDIHIQIFNILRGIFHLKIQSEACWSCNPFPLMTVSRHGNDTLGFRRHMNRILMDPQSARMLKLFHTAFKKLQFQFYSLIQHLYRKTKYSSLIESSCAAASYCETDLSWKTALSYQGTMFCELAPFSPSEAA